MILQSIPARTTHNIADKEDSHVNGNSCHNKTKTGCSDPVRPTWLGNLNRNMKPLRPASSGL
jgi:hypothetical protein